MSLSGAPGELVLIGGVQKGIIFAARSFATGMPRINVKVSTAVVTSIT